MQFAQRTSTFVISHVAWLEHRATEKRAPADSYANFTSAVVRTPLAV